MDPAEGSLDSTARSPAPAGGARLRGGRTSPAPRRGGSTPSAGRFRYALPGFWKVKKALNLGSERRLRESVAMVHGYADRIIRSRREEMSMGCEKHDLLSRFMASQGDSTDTVLRDVVISFLLAGRETTSSAFTWFFWLLSSRPDVKSRIRDEVAAVRARRPQRDLDNACFDLDELREMHYVHAAITESMRLYTPVPVNTLHAQAADVLPDGTAVGAGWFLSYNSYAMGRMESVWGEDAQAYRPERWLDPAEGTFRPDSPFRYLVFHAGPRICLGKEMAYIQMKSIVACVLEEFELEVYYNNGAAKKMKDKGLGDEKDAEKQIVGSNCGRVLIGVAAENMQLRNEVEALKEGKKKMKAMLRSRERKDSVLLMLLGLCVIYGCSCLYLRGYV